MRSQPFEPHRNLDGIVFDSFTDPQLKVIGGFPKTGLLFPGDHRGCICSAIPIWVTPAGDVVPVVSQT